MSELKHATQDLYLVTVLFRSEGVNIGNMPGGGYEYDLAAMWPNREHAISHAEWYIETANDASWFGPVVAIWIIKWELNAGDDLVSVFEEHFGQVKPDNPVAFDAHPATQWIYIVTYLELYEGTWYVNIDSIYAHLSTARSRCAVRRAIGDGTAAWVHKMEIIYGHDLRAVLAGMPW